MHTRSVLFIKPNYFIVSDLLTPSDESSVNDYRQTWHTPGGAATDIDEATGMAQTHFSNRANLKIIPADADTLDCEMKIGWGWGNSGNSTAKVPYVSYGQNKTGNVSYDTVLYPQELGEDNDVSLTRLDTGYDKTQVTALEISVDKKKAYYMLAHEQTDAVKTFGDNNSFDGKMAFFEKNSYGKLSSATIAQGKNLTVEGTDIIKSASPIESMTVSYQAKNVCISSEDNLLTAQVFIPQECENIYFNDKRITPVMDGDYAYIGDDSVCPPSALSKQGESTVAEFKALELEKNVIVKEKTKPFYTLSIKEGTKATGGADYSGKISMPFTSGQSILLTPDYSVSFSKAVKLKNAYQISGKCQYVTETGSKESIQSCGESEINKMLERVPVVRCGNDFYLAYNLSGYEFPLETSTPYVSLTPPADKGTSGGSGGSSSAGGAVPTPTPTPTPAPLPEKNFVDIEGHWAQESIKKMASQGFLKGVSEERFEPDRSLTRAELAAILIRASGREINEFNGCFEDVKSTAWYADVMETAKNLGIIAGDGSGNANAESPVTREEMTKILVCAMEKLFGIAYSDDAGVAFGDRSTISAWAYKYVSAAVGAKLISGDENFNFNPKNSCTRAEAAIVLDRLLALR